MKTGRNPRLKRAVRILAPVMILLVLILHGVSSGAILNPPRPPELSGNIPLPSITLGLGQADSPRDVALTLQILALMTVLSLVPAILLMVTSFTRIIIVIGFVQRAIGLQQSPPQQVIAGLSLFLTMFTMYPTRTDSTRIFPAISQLSRLGKGQYNP